MLLGDARRRVGDESELGLHLAVVSVDGIGELAIGLCAEHLGARAKRGTGVPGLLDAVIDVIGSTPPGKKGFLELHRARNAVQHDGILPAPAQVPLWLAEAELLIGGLIEAAFGVDLDQVHSAAGVADHDLRERLEEAERLLEAGDPGGSFRGSWEALDLARRQFRRKAELHLLEPGLGASGGRSIIGKDGGLGSLLGEVRKLSNEIEVSAFTAEPGEWLWLRQRQSETFKGLSATSADALRAFVFVLGWILRYESYISRHGVDRWQRFRESERAPVTGKPGGPHIDDVTPGGNPGGRQRGVRSWILQLTDVPESQPSFAWGITDALRGLEGSPLTRASLDGVGRLSISFPETAGAEEVKEAVLELFSATKQILALRAVRDAEEERARGEITSRFEAGLLEVGCPVTELAVVPESGYHGPFEPGRSQVRIVLPDPGGGAPSTIGNGCRQHYARNFPDNPDGASDFRAGWNDVFVPVDWDPAHVGRWLIDAVAFHEDDRRAEEKARSAQQTAEEAAIEEMRGLL